VGHVGEAIHLVEFLVGWVHGGPFEVEWFQGRSKLTVTEEALTETRNLSLERFTFPPIARDKSAMDW